MLVDSHCHLQDRKFAGEVEEVIERARSAGVTALVTIGYDMPSSRRAIEIADSHPDIYATIGVHPHDAKTLTARDLEDLARMANSAKVVAVGEIGLDFYRNLSPREDQERAFREQLALARTLRLPVVIHSRDADEEVFAILAVHAEMARPAIPEWQALGVMHTFAGDLPLAQRYIDLGFAISISGTVTYPAAEKTREVAKTIPLSSMMLETDAPYLPPQTIRGQRNEPARVRDVAEYVAQLRDKDFPTVRTLTSRTTAKVLRLRPAVYDLLEATLHQPSIQKVTNPHLRQVMSFINVGEASQAFSLLTAILAQESCLLDDEDWALLDQIARKLKEPNWNGLKRP